MQDARDVAHEEQVSIRLPTALLKRAAELAETLRKDPDNALIGITRATILRLAIAKGLAVLEAEHTEKPAKKR